MLRAMSARRRRDLRAGHYERGLETKAGEVTLKVPKVTACGSGAAMSVPTNEESFGVAFTSLATALAFRVTESVGGLIRPQRPARLNPIVRLRLKGVVSNFLKVGSCPRSAKNEKNAKSQYQGEMTEFNDHVSASVPSSRELAVCCPAPASGRFFLRPPRLRAACIFRRAWPKRCQPEKPHRA
jgi:hypothetical protein